LPYSLARCPSLSYLKQRILKSEPWPVVCWFCWASLGYMVVPIWLLLLCHLSLLF
jgi:hypothetical protein